MDHVNIIAADRGTPRGRSPQAIRTLTTAGQVVLSCLCHAKTLHMSAELTFSCAHKPALRYSLISPWTTCLRLILALISIGWPVGCQNSATVFDKGFYPVGHENSVPCCELGFRQQDIEDPTMLLNTFK